MKRGSNDQLSMLELFEQAEVEQRVGVIDSDADGAAALLGIIERFNAAALAGDEKAMTRCSEDADAIAAKLNGGTTFGCRGGDDAICYRLERLTAAAPGSMPMWGQTGECVLEIEGVPVRLELDGIYGTGDGVSFDAHRVDESKPFPISGTGYRSFLGGRVAFGCSRVEATLAVIHAHLHPPAKAKGRKQRQRDQTDDE